MVTEDILCHLISVDRILPKKGACMEEGGISMILQGSYCASLVFSNATVVCCSKLLFIQHMETIPASDSKRGEYTFGYKPPFLLLAHSVYCLCSLALLSKGQMNASCNSRSLYSDSMGCWSLWISAQGVNVLYLNRVNPNLNCRVALLIMNMK